MISRDMDMDAALDHLSDAQVIGEPEIKHIKATIEDLPKVLGEVKASLMEAKIKLDAEALALQPFIVVSNEDEMKTARKAVSVSNKSIKSVSDMRLNTTRPIDQFKTDLIEAERIICRQLQNESDRVKLLCDNYEIAEAKRIKAEQERIQKEIAKMQELERIYIELKSDAGIKLDRHIKKVCDEIRNRFEACTLETIDGNMALLNGYKPQLKEELYQSFFNIQVADTLVSFDEYLEKKTEAMKTVSFEMFSKNYVAFINAFVGEIKKQYPPRKAELIRLLELGKENYQLAAQQIKEAATLAEEQMLLRETAAKQEEEKKRQYAEDAKAAALLNVELKAQIEMQTAGIRSVKSHLIKATVLVPSAYATLLSFYLRNGGDSSKLDFLGNFAAKNGQPVITGVNYNV